MDSLVYKLRAGHYLPAGGRGGGGRGGAILGGVTKKIFTKWVCHSFIYCSIGGSQIGIPFSFLASKCSDPLFYRYS